MNRRAFLQALGVTATAVAIDPFEIDPERALWVPGRKTIFLPSPATVDSFDVTLPSDGWWHAVDMALPDNDRYMVSFQSHHGRTVAIKYDKGWQMTSALGSRGQALDVNDARVKDISTRLFPEESSEKNQDRVTVTLWRDGKQRRYTAKEL